MKTAPRVLIVCRALALSFGLTLPFLGCGGREEVAVGSRSEEEVKRDEETQKAMEAASQAAQSQKPGRARRAGPTR